MKLVSTNPSRNYEVIGQIEETSEDEVLQKIKLAKSIQKEWEDLGLTKRTELLRELYNLLKTNSGEIVSLISKEIGKPITQSRGEAESGLSLLDWYLNNAQRSLSPETSYENDNEIHKVFFEPKGLVVAITPWNFPFSNIVCLSYQNLLAGNVVINKPDPNTPLLNKKVEEIINKSRLPKGVQQFVHGGSEIGQFLVKQDMDLISFMGSTRTGEYLYKVAAEKMIPILMELGGSAPGIICEDADLDNVIERIFIKRFLNCGQICDGMKRLIVHESIFDKVIDKLSNIVKKQIVGDAVNENTTIGPLVNEKQLNTLLIQFSDAVEKGANVVCGGKQPDNLKGSYFEPTLLTNITKDMKVWKEEVFGPILPIVKFKTTEEAIQLANDTIYGLGAHVFTTNKEIFKKISKEINTGMVSCNLLLYVIPDDPFGGVKKSGIGRNNGVHGFRELTNIKVITFEK